MLETVVSINQRNERWTKAGPVVSHLSEPEVSALEERAVATIGDPSALGLWGFATGTWIAGTIIGGAFPHDTITASIPVLMVFAGLVQFIAGLFAFRRANVLVATAFCSFGAFNVTAAFFFWMQAAGALRQSGPPIVMLGFLLESFAFIALALAIAAVRTNMAIVTVLVTLGIGYALSGIPDLADAVGAPGWSLVGNIGGWFLVASAFFAYYTGMALVVNSLWNRPVFPIFGEA